MFVGGLLGFAAWIFEMSQEAAFILGALAFVLIVLGLVLMSAEDAKAFSEVKSGLPGALQELATLAGNSSTFSSVNVFQTNKGTITVGWKLAPSLDYFSYLSPEDLQKKKDSVVSALAQLLKANPDVDPATYQKLLGIVIVGEVERSWQKESGDPVLGQFKDAAKRAKTVMDLELARATFISQNAEVLKERPDLLDHINAIFDAELAKLVAPDDWNRANG